LATVEETDAPIVSCYLNLEAGLAAARRVLGERVRLLRKTLPEPQRDSFEHALLRVEIVHDSETLIRLGGVGGLLRFLWPDAYTRVAA
jgi:hypothetical protein